MSYARARAELPPPLPPMATVLGAFDLEARRSAQRAGRYGVAAVRRRMPARTGKARSAQRASVRRTGLGYIVRIEPSARVRYPNGVSALEVTRWLEGGTGEFGPRKRPIKPRRARGFHLPSGWVSDVIRGQKGRYIYARVRSSESAAAERLMVSGARPAVAAAERVLGGR